MATATDTSQGAVQAAVNATPTGGTCNIPHGASTWSIPVSVTRPMIIIGGGQGTNSAVDTIITNPNTSLRGGETPLFSISPNIDQRVEISLMRLIGKNVTDAGNSGILMYAPSGFLASQIAIHDITFLTFNFAICNGSNGNAIGWGCVWNCTFTNSRNTLRNAGFHSVGDMQGQSIPAPAWGRPLYMVYEDCTFNVTVPNTTPELYLGDTEYPYNYIIRHCTANLTQQASVGNGEDLFDMHGYSGQASGTGTQANGFGMIIHDNTFNYTDPFNSIGPRLADVRGGVGSLVYNNIINGQSGAYISFRNDGTTGSNGGSILPTNSWSWNNTSGDASRGISQAPIGNPQTGPPAGFTTPSGGESFGGNTLAYPHPLRGTVTPPTPPTNPSALVATPIDSGHINLSWTGSN